MINLNPYTPIANKPLLQQKPVAFGNIKLLSQAYAECYINSTYPGDAETKDNLDIYFNNADVFINSSPSAEEMSHRALDISEILVDAANDHLDNEKIDLARLTYEGAIDLLTNTIIYLSKQ